MDPNDVGAPTFGATPFGGTDSLSALIAPPQASTQPIRTNIRPVSDVHAEYQNWLQANPNGPPVSLDEYARKMDAREKTKNRVAAYGVAPDDTGAKWAAQGVSKGLDAFAQPVGEYTGAGSEYYGEKLDKLLGTTQIAPTFKSAGEGLPRQMLSMIGGPETMTADAALKTYGDTGSLGKSAISAASVPLTLGLAKFGANKVEGAVAKKLLGTFTDTNAPAALEQLSTGVVPKAARVAGAVAGGTVGSELGSQAQSIHDTGAPSNPFTVANVAAQVYGGATMALPESIAALSNRSEVNQVSQDRLAEYANKTAAQRLKETGTEVPQPDHAADQLLKSSIAGTEDPNWRRNLVMDGLDTIAKTTDPVDKQAHISRVAEALRDSRNLDAITDSAERDAKMAYVNPPTDINGMMDLTRRVNELHEYSLSKMDEMAQAGDPKATSAAAYRQMLDQGYIKEKVDLAWLKSNFGDNVERSLSNSNSNAFLMLGQQLANRMLVMAEAGKVARGEALLQVTSTESKSVRDDRNTTAQFVDAMSKVGDKDLQRQLYDRYVHHEGQDNINDTGTSDKFMQEITQVVNKLTAGRDPATVQWKTDKVGLEKRSSMLDEQGQETRPSGEVTRSLSDYVQKDMDGKYTTPVYGRPNRSQREIVMSQMGPEETGFQERKPIQEATPDQELQDRPSAELAGKFERAPLSGSTKEGVSIGDTMSTEDVERPGKDWAGMTDAVRQKIATMAPDELWRTIAPEFMNAGGRINPSLAMKLRPIVKDLVTGIFEAGPKVQASEQGTRSLSETGQRLLQALGSARTDRPAYGQLVTRLNDVLGGSSRDPNAVREGIIRRVAEKAGVGGPQALHTGPDSNINLGGLGRVLPTKHSWFDAMGFKEGEKDYTSKPTETQLKDTYNNGNSTAYIYSKDDAGNPREPQSMSAAIKFKLGTGINDGKIEYTPYKYGPSGEQQNIGPSFTGLDQAKKFVEDWHRSKTKPNGSQISESTLPNRSIAGASQTGDPLQDTTRLFRNFFYKLGYEPTLADHFTKLSLQTVMNFRDKGLEIGKLDSQQAYKALTQSFDKIATAGAYWNPNLSGTGKSLIGLALDHNAGESPKALVAFHALGVLVHELTHDIQHEVEGEMMGVPPTVYSRERLAAWRQMYSASQFYSPERRMEMLTTAAEAVIPKNLLYGKAGIMNDVIKGNLEYGSGSGRFAKNNIPSYEFVNTFAQLVGLGTLTGGNGHMVPPEQVFRMIPEEQALFAKGFYRDLHDNISSVQEAMANPKFREQAGMNDLQTGFAGVLADHMGQLIESTNRMVRSDEPNKSISKLNNLATAMSQGFIGNWQGPAPVISFDEKAQPEEARAQAAIKAVQMTLFGPVEEPKTTETPKIGSAARPPTTGSGSQMTLFPKENGGPGKEGVNLGLAWQTLPLFQQTLQHLSRRGIDVAPDVMATVRDLGPSQSRLSTAALGPFMTSEGKFDPKNPTLNMTDTQRSTFNRVADWQQRNGQHAFEMANGTLGLTKEAKQALGMTFGKLSGNDQQVVAGAIQNVQDSHRILGDQLFESRVQSAANRAARMIMTVQPKELTPITWDKALAAATSITRGMVYDQQGAVVKGMQDLLPHTRDAVQGLLGSGITDSLKELRSKLDKETWFMTEQRPGSHLVSSMRGDQKYMDPAANEFAALQKKQQLEALGHTDVRVLSKQEKQNAERFDAPENLLHHYIDLETAAQDKYLTANPHGLDPDQIATMRAYAPGTGVMQSVEQKGTNKFLQKREGVPTGLGMDYLDNMRDYISRLAGTISRQSIQQKVDLILADRRLDGEDQFKQYVKDNVRAGMQPSAPLERSLKAFSSAYFIAGNLSSAVVIGSHGIMTLPETLTNFDKRGLGNSMGHLTSAISDASWLTSKDTANEVQQAQRSAERKVGLGQPLTPTETKAYLFNKAVNDRVLDKGMLQDIVHEQDIQSMMARKFGVGDKTDTGAANLLTDGLYRVAKGTLALHSFASGYNNRIGFLAGLNQAIEQGMTVNDAYKHADTIRTLGLFAGGKANEPGYIAKFGNENSIPVMRTLFTLQRYGTGIMGRYMEHMSDVITNDPNLTPMQRVQAAKSFGTLFATQLAMGGALGLPFVAATMAILEKKFGINAEAAVRKGIAHLAGADHDNSGFRGLVTELAMNGLPNQMLGVNIGPRLGVQDYLGTSAYDGYNLADLAGPLGSMTTNMIEGLGSFAQGNVQKGITQLLPNVLKRPVDMAMTKMKYGDYGFRDPTGALVYQPKGAELLKYAAGLRPSGLSERMSMKQLIDQSNTAYTKQQGQQEDQIAQQLASGNGQPLQDYIKTQVQQNPKVDWQGKMRAISDRAVAHNQERDPLSSGPIGNAPDQKAIVQTYPSSDIARQSETQRFVDRARIETQAGVPRTDYGKEASRAVVMDKFIQQGMTRTQAERMAMMLGF